MTDTKDLYIDPPPNIKLETVAQRRTRIEPYLKEKLEREYSQNQKPTKKEKRRIASDNDMTEENVHNWFQNRRARASRERKMAKMTLSQEQATQGCSGRQARSHEMKRQLMTPSSSSSSISTVASTSTAPVSSSSLQSPSVSCRLPPIYMLWENDNTVNDFPVKYSPSHTPFIEAYYYHWPFGIESSFSRKRHYASI